MRDIDAPELREIRENARPARFEPAPSDGVLPRGFYATTNAPTFVLANSEWKAAARQRMDGVLVFEDDEVTVVEGRKVREGQAILVGRAEDGSEGVLVPDTVLPDTVLPDSSGDDETGGSAFRFQSTSVSREREIDYETIARSLLRESDAGRVVWVLGPAVVHARARREFIWFVENGFVHDFLGGNAVAAHDIEMSLFGSALGVGENGLPLPDGHALHLRAINEVRHAGSIRALIQKGELRDGIMHSLVENDVPYVLAGSIRDDGPLPDVITDSLEAQNAMREVAVRASMVVVIATQLHGIAFGNMLPTTTGEDDSKRELTTVCVDQTEFAVNKLHDRGSHQAFGVVTNAQDFLRSLRYSVLEFGE